MRIEPLLLETKNNLIKDYRAEKEQVMTYFDYSPFNDYEERLKHLHEHTYERKKLASSLKEQNMSWQAPQSTLDNIDRLEDEKSVVVIGGQQAGVATGPLYTVNKIISILHFANKQEKKLGVPVIPVFWIAGEDHDYDEINHVFMNDQARLKQHKLPQYVAEKKSISNIEIDQNDLGNWINEFFQTLGETAHTKDLYEAVTQSKEQATTYVDFFAHLIFKLFPTSGIVLIDSGSTETRQLESDFFVEMIEKQEEIAKHTAETLEQMRQRGYSIALDAAATDGNLFIMHEEERILLERDEAGRWVGKNEEVLLTTEELINIAKETPERLSNNVVTRPLMQEKLFPTLAFVAGDGEIAYWSVLKEAFHTVGLKLPPVLPRLSLTLLRRQLEKQLDKKQLSLNTVINEGVQTLKMNWLSSHVQPPIHLLAEQMKNSITELHEPLKNVAQSLGDDVEKVAEKNLFYLLQQVDYLENRINKEMDEKYKEGLLLFDQIENELRPLGQLQERVWNIIPFVNEYGTEFIEELTKVQFDYEETHFIVYL